MDIIGIIGIIVIGFIAGLIARAITPGSQAMGLIMTTVLGIAGAFTASFLGQALGLYVSGEIMGWVASVVGAVIVLLVYSLVTRRSV